MPRNHSCPLCGSDLKRNAKLDWSAMMQEMPAAQRRVAMRSMADRERHGRWLHATKSGGVVMSPSMVEQLEQADEDES